MKTYCCQKDCRDTNRNAFDALFNKKVQQKTAVMFDHGFVRCLHVAFVKFRGTAPTIVENIITNNHFISIDINDNTRHYRILQEIFYISARKIILGHKLSNYNLEN